MTMIRPTVADADRALERAREVFRIEARAVESLAERLDQRFADAVSMILACQGRVVVSGIGKSGHIARKIAATLASTGTAAFFVHPAEARHGDLGMVRGEDVMIALSYSGESDELAVMIPPARRLGTRVIAICGNPASTLARHADVFLDAGIEREACPMNLAPTASTTAALAMGDALAVALLDARGFGRDDFARSHPGGALGRQLLTMVRDVMRTGDAVPQVAETATVTEALLEMTRKTMGMTAVTATDGRVSGIFTDGDLRRALERRTDVHATPVGEVMTRAPRTISPEQLATAAAHLMDEHRISQLLVIDATGHLAGALNHHDLMRAKVI
jgi:arabinose-5-phosphate isomerase